jgi:hypothetical protein
VADRVDASVDPVQTSGSKSFAYAVGAEAERAELIASHDAVLPQRKGRNPTIDRG